TSPTPPKHPGGDPVLAPRPPWGVGGPGGPSGPGAWCPRRRPARRGCPAGGCPPSGASAEAPGRRSATADALHSAPDPTNCRLEQERRCVVLAGWGLAYRRPDGVDVVPITTLGP